MGDRAYELASVRATVEQIGGRVRHQSRWLHAVSAEVHTSAITAAQRRAELRHIQTVAQTRGLPERGVPALPPPLRTGSRATDSLFGEAAVPVRRLNLFPLIDNGVEGTGMTIALLDTGFETGLAAFTSTNIIAQYDFVFDDPIVRNEAGDAPGASTHGTQVWSLLAANLPNTIIGIAPNADYILAKTDDVRSDTRVDEDHWVAALEWADSIGVDIVSTSVGYRSFDGGFAYQPRDEQTELVSLIPNLLQSFTVNIGF